jgi:hypothetical protein
VLEVALAVGLLVGMRLHVFAFASGLPLKRGSPGLEPPLSFSVWTAAADACLLASAHTPERREYLKAIREAIAG